MCAGQSYQQPTDESSVTGNTVRSVYRVLRGPQQCGLRSVNRNPAGHNAKSKDSSVKGLSPVKQLSPWWPSHYEEAKAISEISTASGISGTTGVRGHGMLERLLMKPRRSPHGRSRLSRFLWRDVMIKSESILWGEVRCFHSSKEVG